MKTLKSLVVALLALAPLSTFAVGACEYYWMPEMPFFLSAGSVQVIHSGGGGYSVNMSNVNSTNQYSLANGDEIVITPPNCNTWTWGYATFCTCNTQGGLTCGNPQTMQVNGITLGYYAVTVTCNCPYGGSSAGITPIQKYYCGSK